MKNQYFGDNRDLFKYDLVYKIINAGYASLPTRFTFIPMLTEDEGRKKGKPGTKHQELVNFLSACTASEKRNIRELEAFFKDKINIYRVSDYFRSETEMRNEYFKQIRRHLLQKSLILVDPDIGLQKDKPDKEHILYCEVKNLYDRMDRSSVLMIFQYRPRMEKWRHCCLRISAGLTKKVGNLPIHITSDPVIFFFLTKVNNSLRESLCKVISKYGESYRLKVGNV